MALMYKNEHLSCSYYSTSSNWIFKVLNVKAGEKVTRRYIDRTFLVFLVEGNMRMEYGVEVSVDLRPRNIFLLPKHFEASFQTETDSTVLLCSFTNDIELCSRFSLQKLSGSIPEHAAASGIFFLPFDNRLSVFADFMTQTLTEGLGCVHYHSLKRDELFIYLRAGYTKEELALFFYPILGQNLDFKDFVLSNYKNVCDVQEFARKANLSLRTFNRRFKEAFHVTAQQWLLDRRSERVLQDIKKSDMTFNEIAEKYNFSSPSYFAAFCKKQYGKTANDLRKEARDAKL